ncbi:hypothetical protein NFI96_022422 [Prochilodus magdalenae]|nr:hypothetical protein NFI96_022422 [Prochilodus magdalenae]
MEEVRPLLGFLDDGPLQFCLSTGSSDVVRSVGDSVQLDIQRPVPKGSDLIWVFNETYNVLQYYQKFRKTKHYAGYKDRVEFNEGTYSLTLKNLQKTDSGLYEVRASGDEVTVVAEYSLSVLDPVEAPVLTHQLIRDTCSITLTCRGHDLSINSSCYKETCEEKEETSPGGVTLSLSVEGSSIICNHSNPVSWKEAVLEMGELKRLCADRAESTLTQQSITVSLESCAPYDKKSKRWKEITDAIACLAKDMMPVQTVEKEGFTQLIKKLDRRYSVPKRQYFSRTALPDMYEECREKVAASLSCAEFYASTTDIWSSTTTEPYLRLTVHYINSEWKLCSPCLETSYFPKDHTGHNIADSLREFLQSWCLKEEKQVCVTTDSGPNVVKAIELNNWTRLSCFGHRLHIAIEFTDALSAEDYVTASCLKPVLQLFNSDILQVRENDTDLTKTIKNSTLEYLNSKYEDPEVEELISLATMLDPRFHTQYMGPEEIQFMKARAVQEMQSFLSEQRSTSAFEAPLQGSGSAEGIGSDAKRPKNTLGSFFKRAVPGKRGQSEKETTEAELNSCLQCSPADNPVEAPVLTLHLIWSTCNFTLTCRGHDLSISSRCYKETCEEKEVTSPGGVTLSLSVRASSIICNHSNPVSWKEVVLETGELKRLCADGAPVPYQSHNSYILYRQVSLIGTDYTWELWDFEFPGLSMPCCRRPLLVAGRASDVVRSVGDSVQLDIQLPVPKGSDLTWVFNGTYNVLQYYQKFRKTKQSPGYEDRVEFNEGTYSLTLKNLQKTDSGLYEARASGDKVTVVAVYSLSVLDPVEAPVLTYQLIWTTCSITLTCRGHDLSISSSCYKETCEEKEVTSPEGVTLSLSVRGSSIICNQSNPVSWKEDVQEMGELKPLCAEADPVEDPVLTQLNNDTCSITLTCRGHGLSINSSCSKETCEEKEVTSPGGVTLSLYVRGSSIICNLSNPVSWKEDVLEMGELKRVCADGGEGSGPPWCPGLPFVTVSWLCIVAVGSSDVVRSVGDSVQLDIRRPVTEFDDLTWEFNRTNYILKYFPDYKKTRQFPVYTDRVEFNEGTYSLTLKNLQKTDSGLYEAKASDHNVTVVAEYRLSVLDPVEAPVLTLHLIWSTCNITLTCRGHDLSISSSCYNKTCEEKEVTSPGGVTLSLSVRGSSIICNHSNPASWKEDVLEMGKLKHLCADVVSEMAMMMMVVLQLILPLSSLISITDPVEAPVLTYQVIRDTCSVTLTCRGHEPYINSICYKETCEQKEVTSPGGVTLSRSVRGSSIICNQSNPVSWDEGVLVMGELKHLCADGAEGVYTDTYKHQH